MNFLLINALGGFNYIASKKRKATTSSYMPPLGLLYLAQSLLDEGHHVNVLDFYNQTQLLQSLNTIDAVGISVNTQYYHEAATLSALIKEKKPTLPIIIGGPHPTFHPEQSLRDIPTADISVCGEADLIIKDLAAALNGSKKIANIPGISYRQNNTIKPAKHTQWIKDLDSIPFPARHLVKQYDYGKIHNTYIYKPKFASMITSRGCPFNCRFCTRHVFSYKTFRQRSAQNVIDEIQEISEQHKSLMMVDDNFLTDKKRVNHIFDAIIQMKLDLDIIIPSTRVDAADRTLYKKMKKAGVIFLGFGIESGNQEILDYYRKRTTLPQIRKAINMSREMNFITLAYFILGAPMETKEQIKNTIDFACSLPIDISLFTPLYYMYGSDLWNEAINDGKITKDDGYFLKASAENGLGHFTSSELENYCNDAVRRFYFRPSYLIKQFYRSIMRKDLGVMKLGLHNVL
jgi:anaerobic magnesium-protoporphyrin IX monomethyl ester cyclase